jgi:hypothetical protein
MKPITHNGAVVSIAHLAPMTLLCPCHGLPRDLVIEVDFTAHCYTEKYVEGQHTDADIVTYDGGNRPRIFCPIRHNLSHRLPEIVAGLPNKKVKQTAEKRNYVYVVPLEIGGQVYEMYFMIQRAEQRPNIDLRMTVESAYIPTDPTPLGGTNSIRFKVLASKILRREEIKFPAR